MADNGLDIGTLSGRIELEDRLSGVLDLAGHKVSEFDEKFGGLGHHILEQATAFFSAEAALHAVEGAIHLSIEAIKEMTIEGAKVADVEQNFDRLTEAGGRLGQTLLNELREGTHSTITNFELMQMANRDLAAGMNLTDAQFRTLAKGAFALAQATGTDVKEALDKMNDAMLTGRTRAVAMLTGKIDLSAAEEKYAASLGVTADHLSAEGKIEAARAAILEKVSAATERLGEQTDGLDEKIEQAQASWGNFTEDLGKSIATSHVVMAGVNGIQDALVEAFGGDQKSLIDSIVTAIENGAIAALDFSKTIVDGVGIAGMEWNAFKVVIETSLQGFRAITFVVEEITLAWLKFENIITLGASTNIHNAIDLVKGDLDRLYNNMAEGENRIATYKKSQQEWAESTGHVNEAIEKIEARMKAARAEIEHSTETTNEHANADKLAAAEATAHADAQGHLGSIVGKTAAEIAKMAEAQKEIASAGRDYKEILGTINEESLTSIRHYLEVGVSQDKLATAYGLTAVQIGAVVKALKDEADAMKLEQKQLSDSAARWSDFYAQQVELGGTATDKSIANIEKWKAAQIKSHTDAKTDTADFYDWLGKTEALMYEKGDKARLEADEHSQAHFEKIAKDAAEAYTFATEHADQFTSEYINDLRKTKDAAADAAMHWRTNLGGALDEVSEKVRTLSGEMITLDEKANRMKAGGSTAINAGNLAQNAAYWGVPETVAQAAAKKGFSFEEIVSAWQSQTMNSWVPHGPRIPGFRDGGVGDFGEGTLAMLHGKEAIVPLDKGGLGEPTINIYVNGTGAEVARQVSRELMRTLKQYKQYGAA